MEQTLNTIRPELLTLSAEQIGDMLQKEDARKIA